MLELSLSGGGLWGMTLTGFLYGLRDRGLVPDVVTAVSSAVHAGYLTYSGGDYEHALRWFQLSRDHMRSKPLRRFFPPYDYDGRIIGRFTQPFLVNPTIFRTNGLKHFFVGYVYLRGFRFAIEDIIPLEPEVTYRVILRSSTIPFVTNFVPHFEGCVDGGFKRNSFVSDLPVSERWIITYQGMEQLVRNCGGCTRLVVLPRLSRYSLYATNAELHGGFEQGFELANSLSLA